MQNNFDKSTKSMTLWQKFVQVLFCEEGVCINCLRCVEACPENKHPNYLLFSSENASFDNTKKQNSDRPNQPVELSNREAESNSDAGEEGRGADYLNCIQCKKCEKVCPAGFSFFNK
ncbi:MAG: 4Fe-4S dicluster domain-containing protein [Candidatus Riflebacteria bacterium]|nr:4Fe-4S dicluster domain-containing protein [Candidatus Riflebacteria bacterium]